MKSIKPGRGPSMTGVVMGIFVAFFGVIWTGAAVSMGAPIFFALFGVGFVAVAISGAVYNFKNATGKKRYSLYDITTGDEEPDPLNERFGHTDADDAPDTASRDSKYCPFCGARLEARFRYCNQCGEKLP